MRYSFTVMAVHKSILYSIIVGKNHDIIYVSFHYSRSRYVLFFHSWNTSKTRIPWFVTVFCLLGQYNMRDMCILHFYNSCLIITDRPWNILLTFWNNFELSKRNPFFLQTLSSRNWNILCMNKYIHTHMHKYFNKYLKYIYQQWKAGKITKEKVHPLMYVWIIFALPQRLYCIIYTDTHISDNEKSVFQHLLYQT